MGASNYPMILEEEPEDYVLVTQGSVRTYFDEIEATGMGYWELRLNGEQVAIVSDLSEWSSESVQAFRRIQFGEAVA